MEGKKEEEPMLLALPQELLSHILLYVPTSELYPHCFVVCKSLLSALRNEVAWEERCLLDLDVTEKVVAESWFLTYKEESIGWDQIHHGPTIEINGRIAISRDDSSPYASVRVKRPFVKGRHTFVVLVEEGDTAKFRAVSLSDDTYDCQTDTTTPGDDIPYYCMWTESTTFWDSSGCFSSSESTLSPVSYNKGDKVTLVVDMDERTINYYHNDKLVGHVAIKPQHTKLYPTVTMRERAAARLLVLK